MWPRFSKATPIFDEPMQVPWTVQAHIGHCSLTICRAENRAQPLFAETTALPKRVKIGLGGPQRMASAVGARADLRDKKADIAARRSALEGSAAVPATAAPTPHRGPTRPGSSCWPDTSSRRWHPSGWRRSTASSRSGRRRLGRWGWFRGLGLSRGGMLVRIRYPKPCTLSFEPSQVFLL